MGGNVAPVAQARNQSSAQANGTGIRLGADDMPSTWQRIGEFEPDYVPERLSLYGSQIQLATVLGDNISPELRNARNGGLNVRYSTAEAEGVTFSKNQFRQEPVSVNVNSAGKAFNDDVIARRAWAFNRDTQQRSEQLHNNAIQSAANTVIQEKEIIARNANNPVQMWDGNKHPTLTLEQVRKNFRDSIESAYVKSSLVGMSATALPLLGAKTVMGVTGAMDVGGQYYLSEGFKNESYKPIQTLFAMTTAGITVKLGGAVTSGNNFYRNAANAGLLGGTVAATNTLATNYFYNENKDPVTAFGYGMFFGGGSSYLTAKFLIPPMSSLLVNPSINRNIPILYQNYRNPNAEYWGSAVISSVLSNLPSWIDTPER